MQRDGKGARADCRQAAQVSATREDRENIADRNWGLTCSVLFLTK